MVVDEEPFAAGKKAPPFEITKLKPTSSNSTYTILIKIARSVLMAEPICRNVYDIVKIGTAGMIPKSKVNDE